MTDLASTIHLGPSHTSDASIDAAAFAPLLDPLNRALLDALPVAVVVRAGADLIANRTALELLGLSHAQLRREAARPASWRARAADSDDDGDPWDADATASRSHGEAVRLRLRRGDAREHALVATTWHLGGARGASCLVLVPDDDARGAPRDDHRSLASERDENERLATVARYATDGVCLTDRRGRIEWVNDAFVRLIGFSRDECIGRIASTLLEGPETNAETAADMHQAVAAGQAWRGDLVGYRKSGRTFWAEIAIMPVLERDGGRGRVVAHVRDVSERRQAERRTRQLTAAVDASLDGIAIIDGFQEFRYVNESFAQLYGFEKAEPLIRTSWRTLYDERELGRFDRDILPNLYLGDRWRGESIGRRVDGTHFPQELALTLLPGGILVCVVRDITDRKASEETLRRISLTDSLTGLYNRRGFMLLAQQSLNGASRVPGHTVLLYLDVNSFKPINDTYGHTEGDAALVAVSEVLRATFRESDLIARLGGDEFVVLATNCLDSTGAVLERRLDEQLAERNAASGRRYTLALARGLVRFDPERPKSLIELMDAADRKLYENKRAGSVSA